MRRILILLGLLAASPAFAWDPSEGAQSPAGGRADIYSPSPNRPYLPPSRYDLSASRPLFSVAPVQNYAPPPLPVAPAAATEQAMVYTAPTVPTPVSVAPSAPVAYSAPALPPPPTDYYGVQQTAAAAPAPAYVPPETPAIAPGMDYQRTKPSARDLLADMGSIGVEAFYDNYQEDVVGLDSEAMYGSLTAAYQHFMESGWFFGMDGRASYGNNDYASISGTISSVPQWEFESRGTSGFRFVNDMGGTLDVYGGLGARYYRDEGKGEHTDLGAAGYDRRIFQAYLPIGVTHRVTGISGWTYGQNLEADALLFGSVSSRLAGSGLSGYENIVNRQDPFTGFGLRAEVTFANLDASGSGFEFGPFVRYWYIDDSNPNTDRFGTTWIEPENTRLQLGMTARWLY